MMNFVALCLVVTSIAGAAVWSPATNRPQKLNSHPEDYIVRQGHKSVLVEYDTDGKSNTRVSFSPEYEHALDNGKEEAQQTDSRFPNLGHRISQKGKEEETADGELICDALGKCKHKIADAIGKVKEKLSGTVHGDLEMKRERARDFVSKNKEAVDEVRDVVGKAKETISSKAHDLGEGAKETLKKAKDAAVSVKDTSKTLRVDVVGNVSNEVAEKTRETTEAVKDTASKVVAGAGKVSHEGKKGLSEILHRSRQIANFMGLEGRLEALSTIVHLLGFTTAYGTCVWITFVSSYVLSRALSRQQFGVVQSKIYPVYFRAMAYGIGMALFGHVFGKMKKIFTSKAEALQVYNLLMSLLTVFLNSMYLEPRATRVMFERMKAEKEEGRGREDATSEPTRPEQPPSHLTRDHGKDSADPTGTPSGRGGGEEEARARIIRLNEKLKKLNSYSSLVNILTLMSLSWHLVYLSQQLEQIPG